MKQKLIELKGEIEKSTIKVGGLNNPLLRIDRVMRQKIGKDIEELNKTNNQQGLIQVYRTLHLTTAEYRFFSGAHGIFNKIYHKSNLNKFKEIKIIQSVFAGHNGIKLEINDRKK